MTKIWAFYCFIEWYELYFEEKNSAGFVKKFGKTLDKGGLRCYNNSRSMSLVGMNPQ